MAGTVIVPARSQTYLNSLHLPPGSNLSLPKSPGIGGRGFKDFALGGQIDCYDGNAGISLSEEARRKNCEVDNAEDSFAVSKIICFDK